MITTKELLQNAYIMGNWDIRMTPEDILKLANEAKNYADKLDKDSK
jgi:hypothetical protein